MTESSVIQETQYWLQAFVVDLVICPFAKREIEKHRLRIQVSNAKKLASALEDLLMEFIFLDKNADTETTLLIFPHLLSDFFKYLEFVDFAELLLHEEGYEGVYQLATFHPNYCFADTDFDDITNYTNRSPYPMLHILREASLEKAIASYGDTQKIPEKNAVTLKNLGLKSLLALLQGDHGG